MDFPLQGAEAYSHVYTKSLLNFLSIIVRQFHLNWMSLVQYHPAETAISESPVSCRQVVGVFDARQWGHINCHLHDKLGFHAAEAGDYAAAANHFAETLVCSGTHPTRQKSLFQQFLGNLEKLSPEQASDSKPNRQQRRKGRRAGVSFLPVWQQFLTC